VLQDRLLSVFHATSHTLNGTPTVKVIENHLGKAYIRLHQQLVVGPPPGMLGMPPKPPAGPGNPK
jgi:hypothetical protein